MKQAILGISAYYHDSAACLIVEGELVGAVQEERFTRIKHDASFPTNSVKYLLDNYCDFNTVIVAVAFYEKPYIKFERLLETYHGFAPKGFGSFLRAIPVWIKDKLFIKKTIATELEKNGLRNIPIFFPEHHLSHAASGFFPSPFETAAILTIDGVGEWATTTIGRGEGNSIQVLKEITFPHSLGLLYSSFTYYCGFKVNSGEYKLMGLAPYGNINDKETTGFIDSILSQMLDIRSDGSYLLNMKYFSYATGLKMTNDKEWEKLFGVARRKESEAILQSHMNLALAIQKVTEKIILLLAQTARQLTGCKDLVMAGGVALNCVANGLLDSSRIFNKIWIQPAAGDAGGAVGAAMAVHLINDHVTRTITLSDGMKNCYLGPEFSDHEVAKILKNTGAVYHQFDRFDDLSREVAALLAEGNIVGWFQGKMEFGPRALGNRSILGDPRNIDMQLNINEKIKFRENFRPFAPAILQEDVHHYFDNGTPSPYMLFTRTLKESMRMSIPDAVTSGDLLGKLYHKKSTVPAVTHIDYSARLQSVSQDTNPRFWKVLSDFKVRSGMGMLVNTSFNVRGEPIVCDPLQAFHCFMRTGMNYLVIGNFLFDKQAQTVSTETLQEDYVGDD